MARKPSRKAVRSAGHLMLAPAVMAMRMPLLLAEAQSNNLLRKETSLASSEKATAYVEGALAAQASLASSLFSFWPEVMSGRAPSLLNGSAVEKAVEAAMGPSGRAVNANFRRLSRPK